MSAKNFLCFGENGIEIDLGSYDNIIPIKGYNYDDVNPSTSQPGSNGTGKCLGINTPVIMYDGRIELCQNIKVGDLLMGDDSTPRRVLSTTKDYGELYEVHQERGKSYVVNKDHILSFKHNKHQTIINISVQDYLEKPELWKQTYSGWKANINRFGEPENTTSDTDKQQIIYASNNERKKFLFSVINTEAMIKQNSYLIKSRNLEKLNHLAFIANSLSLDSSISSKDNKYYELEITGNFADFPVDNQKKIDSPLLTNKIVLEKINNGYYYGFELDKNHLFCLGDFTVTHNSSIEEIPVFAFYGKTIKKLKNQDLIVNQTTKNRLKVEVRWDNYRIIRCLKPNSLKFEEWDGEKWNDKTMGAGAKETQKLIEATIGLNYRSFINIVVFDYNSTSFLDCDASTKRSIVENLLSLDKYSLYHETVNELKKESKKKIKELSDDFLKINNDISHLKQRLMSLNSQEESWKNNKKSEIQNILNNIKNLNNRLENCNDGELLVKYNQAQEQINVLQKEVIANEKEQEKYIEIISSLNDKKIKFIEKLNSAKNQKSSLLQEKNNLENEISNLNQEIVKMENSEAGVRCKVCLMEAEPNSFAPLIEFNKKRINELTEKIKKIHLAEAENLVKKFSEMLLMIDKKITEAHKDLLKISNATKLAKTNISSLQNISKPKGETEHLLLSQQIENLKSQILEKKIELKTANPFSKMKTASEEDIVKTETFYDNKKKEIQEAEKLLPYYEYWTAAFGDSGIRKYVIDRIIDPLNERIAYWLNYLIYGNISLKFNNELEDTIRKFPFADDLFVYDQLSGGERRRLNLSVPLSFAYCMELSSGSSPNIVFLDEVAVNIDENGIEGIFNMIKELSQNKKVFVTDHNPILLELLEPYKTITLERKNKITNLTPQQNRI